MYRENVMKRILSFTATVSLLAILCPAILSTPADSDVPKEKKRSLLASVHRIAVIPLFYGADAAKSAANKKKSAQGEKPAPKLSAAQETRRNTFQAQRQELLSHANERLPERVATRLPYEVLSKEETNAALAELKLKPEDLFKESGVTRGTKFPLPLPEQVKKLAVRMKVDAVIVGVLDDPRYDNGHYYFDPLYGVNYESGHVNSRAGFYFMLANGTEILHAYMSVKNPLTPPQGRDYRLADWTDAQELMIENMMDEWTQFTPTK